MRKLRLIDPKWRLSPRSAFETRRDFFRTGANPPWDSLDADRRADLARRMAVGEPFPEPVARASFVD